MAAATSSACLATSTPGWATNETIQRSTTSTDAGSETRPAAPRIERTPARRLILVTRGVVALGLFGSLVSVGRHLRNV